MKLFLTIIAIAGALAALSTINPSYSGKAASTVAPAPVLQAAFVHPGMLHAEADFARMRAQVNANAQPWRSGWDRLAANPHSQLSWTPRPLATVIRGGAGQNYPQLYMDEVIFEEFKGTGNLLASASNATAKCAAVVIIGFNARPEARAEESDMAWFNTTDRSMLPVSR